MKYTPHDPRDTRRQLLRNLMLEAWELATEAKDRHGGKRVDYIPATMAEAWAVVKGNPAAWVTADLMVGFRPG